jgi:hypothetical protein
VIGVLVTVVESDRTGGAARTFVWRRRKELCGTSVSVPGYLFGPSTAGIGNGLDSSGFESHYMFPWSGQGQLYFITFTIAVGLNHEDLSISLCESLVASRSTDRNGKQTGSQA